MTVVCISVVEPACVGWQVGCLGGWAVSEHKRHCWESGRVDWYVGMCPFLVVVIRPGFPPMGCWGNCKADGRFWSWGWDGESGAHWVEEGAGVVSNGGVGVADFVLGAVASDGVAGDGH